MEQRESGVEAKELPDPERLAWVTGAELPRAGNGVASLARYKVDSSASSALPAEFVKRHRIMPLEIREGFLHVATVEPGNPKVIDDIRLLSGFEVKEWVAPQNAKRLNRNTPCIETGLCADCNSPDRICNIYVTLAKKPSRTDVTVLLVGEQLGI